MLNRLFLLSLLIIFALPSLAAAETVWERFSEFDPDSKVRVNHEPFSEVLSTSVLPVGRSRTILGEQKPETYHNSRIKTSANLSPSRFEGNRVMFHAFSDDLKDFFKGYQEGLENLSNRRPLKELNKDEQLAFWLNLHNIIVINKLSGEYPIKKLKSLRETYWDDKVTTVEGVALSLNDIESIVMHNWEDPIVVYGLWQGSVGGPRLPYSAYTASNVWKALDKNAEEFVNSNRGAIPKRGAIYASDFYEWVLPAFGGSEQEVLKHIKRFSDPRFHGDISDINKIKFKYYDWVIADLLGGTLHSGGRSSDAALLTARTSPDAAGTESGNVGGAAAFYNIMVNRQMDAPPELVPPGAQNFLKGIYLNNQVPVFTPIITTEECGPDDDSCFGEQVVPEEAGDDNSDQ